MLRDNSSAIKKIELSKSEGQAASSKNGDKNHPTTKNLYRFLTQSW